MAHAQKETLNPKKRYLVAVSGGLDSAVLLHWLTERIPASQLVIAHFNHGVRKSATRDERFVKALGKQYGIKTVTGRRLPRRRATLSEDFLRTARRQFLQDAAKTFRCDRIATAHHANDQLETLFMRLLRGTTPFGLVSMKAKNGKWIKPLLPFSRDELLEYAQKNNLRWKEDETNGDERYLRNAIRKRLVPLFLDLGKNYGSARQITKRTASLLAEQDELTKSFDRDFQKEVRAHLVFTPFWIRFSRTDFLSFNSPWKRSLFIKTLLKELGVPSATRSTLQRIEKAMVSGVAKITCVSDVSGELSCGYWYFQNKNLRRRAERGITFRKIGETYHCDEIAFEGKLFLPEGAKLRTPAPGDRFGTKKLKVVLLSERIPAPERRLLPVVARGPQVEWTFSKQKAKSVTPGITCKFPFVFNK